MKARRYTIELNGETPLLLHHDNIPWSETMSKWEKDPGNKADSVKGDDRSPAWRWIGCLYVEADTIVLPADNLMTMMREGGKRCPTGKGKSTFKAQSQSGIIVDQSAWPILIHEKPVSFTPIKALYAEKTFQRHADLANELGFELFVKRAVLNGGSKNVRVRPRFDNWAATGSVTVVDDMITTDVLTNILQLAGAYAGLGDWRPSAPKSPGSFGKFTATVTSMQ